VSAFYVSNRKDGFVLSGSILAKSKFYGNSLSAILDGVGRLVFLKRGEDYLITMPYAHCKGSGSFCTLFGYNWLYDCFVAYLCLFNDYFTSELELASLPQFLLLVLSVLEENIWR